MSSRSHVDVNERRLRPIYECLDNGNNKKALQEADKVLRKQKDLLCAKVLKALALLRLGRHDESMQLLQEVHVHSPTDESTLLAMGIAYRELHKLELVADMYENAHREKPDNEEVLSALFMAYVRLSDYKKQQQTAMKLHRLKPTKNPYYFWAVMSIVMQAHMDKKLAKSMYLPLAERMVSKYVTSNKIEAEAEVQMYLIVLEELEKYEEALGVIRSPLGDRLVSDPRFFKAKEAELLTQLERWAEANCAYRKLLRENNDDWMFYKGYFKTAFALIDANWSPSEEESIDGEVDYSLERIVAFLAEEVTQAKTGRHVPRGPFLAQLELLKLLNERETAAPEGFTSADSLIRQYLEQFGDKPGCYADLNLYMHLPTNEQVQKIIDDLLGEMGMKSETDEIVHAKDPKLLQEHLNLLQLSHHSGLHENLSSEEKLRLVEQLIQRYQAGLPLGEGLLLTDLQYSDCYLMLAAHIMADIHSATGDRSILWRAIVHLEKALKRSPSNFQMKLLLIKFYSRLGALGPCLVLYESMEIKHIQNDSLGYTIVNYLCQLGHFSAASSIYGAMLRFFTVNHKDTTEYLTASYKFGSFSKIYEFVQFRERLQNSLQHASASTERLMLDLTLETASHQDTEKMLSYMEMDPVEDKTAWDDLRDNRDLHVMVNWDPPSKSLSSTICEQSFREEVAWLKMRSLTLRSLAAAVGLGQHTGPNNNTVGNGNAASHVDLAEVLGRLVTELREHLNTCAGLDLSTKYPLCGPVATRLDTYMKGHYADLLLVALEMLLYVNSLREGGLEKRDNTKEESMETLHKKLKEKASECRHKLLQDEAGNSGATFSPLQLASMVHTAELLSHVTIILGACHRILKPIRTAIGRRNKKKKENPPPLPETFGHFTGLVQGLGEAANEADEALAAINVELLAAHLDAIKLDNTGSEEDAKFESELRQNLSNSYEQSIKEVRDLIKTKRVYLSGLTL